MSTRASGEATGDSPTDPAAPDPAESPVQGDAPPRAVDRFDRSPPDVAAWTGLPDDLFARVAAHARRGLQKLDTVHTTPEVKRLLAIPPSKLVKGGGRRRLVAVMAAGGPVWLAIRTRLDTDPELEAELASALGMGPDTSAAGDDALRDQLDETGRRLDRMRGQRDDARSHRDELRDQRDLARRERDEARARLDGALGRETAMQRRIETLEHQDAQWRARVDELTAAAAAADQDLRRAVEREARRSASRQVELERELATARRDLDRANRDVRRLERTRQGESSSKPASPDDAAPGPMTGQPVGRGPGTVGRPVGDGATSSPVEAPDVVVPGRPSRLPTGVRLDTREGGVALLTPGRVVLVDGYNVTRSHRPDMSLEQQRRWLVDGVANLATRLKLDATIVFDAHDHGAGGPAPRRRGVTVAWSHPGITADDELVLAVEAMDRTTPVVVVTDDRELRGRLAALGVDLLQTNVLAWLL